MQKTVASILSLEARYRAYLTAEAANREAGSRWFGVRGICLPWLAPLALALVIAMIFSPQSAIGLSSIIIFGVISFAGTCYAGGVFIYQGVRIDLRRFNEKQQTEPLQPAESETH